MNVKRLSKRTLATLLSVLLLLSTLVVGATATANAAWGTESESFNNLYVYFDNSKMNYYVSKTSTRVYMFVATADKVYYSNSFTPVTGTSLVYKDVNYQGNGDFKDVKWGSVQCVFFGTAGAANKGAGSYTGSVDSFKNSTTVYSNFTASYSVGFSVNNRNKLYFSGDTSSLTAVNLGGSTTNPIEAINIPQNVYGVGTVAVDSYTSITNTGEATLYTSGTGTNANALYDSSVTIKAVATVASGDFVGWYDNRSFTGDAISTNSIYEYTVKGANNFYAKFENDLSQSVNSNEGGTVSVSDGTNSGGSISVTPGTNVTFTATPNPKFTFNGWYDNAQYTGEPVSTLDPYKINSVSSANTLYAKFSAVEAATEEDNGDTAPPEETAPANRNDKKRDVNSVSLSEQAVKYYTEEVKDVDSYKTADSGNSGVYSTFEILKSKEDNKNQDSFDSIYADTAKSGDARYSKVSSEDDKYKYVIKNSLFGALYDIMSSTQTHSVSYPAYGKNSLAHYWLTTDSSKGNWKDNRGVYTFFYSDVDDYNHADMQREHIWPKSKASYLMKTGLGGSDLHHLRPAYGKINNIKSNWGFASIKGESGWTNRRTVEYPKGTPSLWRADKDGETFIDVKDDVRGDVARILLYIYTRWREPNLYSDIFDSDGNPDTSKLPELDPDDKKDTGERIIYDKATLLNWMKNDPVSEWEMKRNDLTQDIQGNRNVFIDYPELAWLIFDENVPADMDTPSRPQGQNRTEINKISASSVTYTDPVTIDISTIDKGVAEITAYDLTTNKAVKNGDTVERGDLITYTVVPDKSTITYVREYQSGSNGQNDLYNPNSNSTYTFTKQAGYYKGAIKTGDDADKEIIKITLKSDVFVLNLNINSTTKDGNSGGSGSGMVLAQYAAAIGGHKKSEIINSGDPVPNGASVTLTFTPDYGSRFYGVTNVHAYKVDDMEFNEEKNYTVSGEGYTFTKVNGTNSYKYTTTYSSASAVRNKKVTVYFAQTFNNTAGSDDAKKHINNKGMRPDENDNWKDETDFTTNFEICGVQIKKFSDGNDNKALRFVSVIDKNILDKAESYGYVIGRTTHSGLGSIFINSNSYTLVKDGANALTVPCTDTDNTVFGDYGKHDTTTNYKYITAAIENIPDSDVNTTIIARPYVVLKDDYVGAKAPKVIYGQYVNFSTGENYCSISTSYNHIYEMANTNKEEE